MRTNATLAFPGEISGNIELEHMHRYIYALAFAKGKTILDIASGEGYGTALLASQAAFVTGVDLAEEAVAHARQKYRLSNLEFRLGSCSKIPLPDATVDLVVSFETIEHHDEHEQMLAEIKRVLKPDGVVIISSPDKAIYTNKPGYHSPKELYREEFEALLHSRFKNVVSLGQKVMFGSGIIPVGGGAQTTFTSTDLGGSTSRPGLMEAMYNLIIASDAALAAAPSSFLDVSIDASEHVKTWKAAVAQRDGDIQRLQGKLAERSAQLAEKDAQLAELSAQLAKQSAQIAEYLFHLDRINAWGWFRLGLFLDRLIRSPLALFASQGRSAKAAIKTNVETKPAPSPEAIALPISKADPEVSVVILSYGQVDFTLRCLNSIAEHPPLCSVEIIISDDCSGATELDKLTQVANLTFLQPPENLGFLKHANWAVAQTKGKYVLLLNNDTELKPGAIDALVETARRTPDAGLVGSKLVYPDGRLQEAGGIVWNDASAWNYGRLGDPGKPEYNYVRDADYVSAAAILVPRAVWDRLGGFDEIFAPAYYEDTDLAFRLRQSGLRVIYQPRSVVVHYEGVSHGVDVNAGVKAYQVANQTRMKERWLATLQAGQYPNGEHIMRARDRSKDRRTMLMIDHYVPEPDRDAGSRNMVEVIKSLQLEGWVVKFWPDGLRFDSVYTPRLQQLGVETMYAPWATSFDAWLKDHAADIDLFFLSRPNVAPKYMNWIKRIVPGAPTIFYGHDLHSARMRMQSRVTHEESLAIEATAIEAIERQIWREADVVLYPSREEAGEVKRLEPSVDARALVPFCFDEFRPLRAPPASSAILFVAGFAHPPNIDAALWLAEEILPLVRRDLPHMKLWIVGSNPVPPVRNLASYIIDVTGWVTEYELANKYAAARAAVVPLRFGAGVKLKVVEALWEGLPLVTTSIGAQGLEGLREVAAVVDEAPAIAQELVRLLRDDVSWVEQAQRQLRYARAHFSRQESIAAMAEATSAAATNAERRKRGAGRDWARVQTH